MGEPLDQVFEEERTPEQEAENRKHAA
jgi:hypothetical protein